VIIVGFLPLSLLFLCFAPTGQLPVPSMIFAYATVVVAAVPIAIFTIVPNAVVADIAEADGIETGNFKAGMFLGVRSFETNLGVSAVNIIFPSLLLLGMSVDHPVGIRLSAVVAIVVCIAGLLVFLMYDEKAVLRSLAKKQRLSTKEIERLEDAQYPSDREWFGSAMPSSTAHRTASSWSSMIFPNHSRSPALVNALPNPVEERKLTPNSA